MALTTATYTRYRLSEQMQYSELGGKTVLVVNYRLVKNAGTVLDFPTELTQILTEAALPKIGQALSGSGLLQFLRCRGYSYQQMADGEGSGVLVTVTFDTMYAQNRNDLARFDLASSWEYNAVTRTVPLYRRSWTSGPPANLDESASDIGGTALTGGDASRSNIVTQVRARLKFIQDATVGSGMIGAATSLASYTGYSNSASFGGFPARTLVCEGVNIGKLDGEYYQIIFDFLYDPWYHHEQYATLDADGKVKLTSGNPTEVKWKRQTRSTVDFNSIWAGDATLQAMTNKGYY
jgi:hypothetical protein